jgi:hypothetical protein
MSQPTKKTLANQDLQRCPRCNKAVYPMERISVAGDSYHRWCFMCENCKSTLNLDRYVIAGGTFLCKKCATMSPNTGGKEFSGNSKDTAPQQKEPQVLPKPPNQQQKEQQRVPQSSPLQPQQLDVKPVKQNQARSQSQSQLPLQQQSQSVSLAKDKNQAEGLPQSHSQSALHSNSQVQLQQQKEEAQPKPADKESATGTPTQQPPASTKITFAEFHELLLDEFKSQGTKKPEENLSKVQNITEKDMKEDKEKKGSEQTYPNPTSGYDVASNPNIPPVAKQPSTTSFESEWMFRMPPPLNFDEANDAMFQKIMELFQTEGSNGQPAHVLTDTRAWWLYRWITTQADPELAELRLAQVRKAWTLSFFHPFKNYHETEKLLTTSSEDAVAFRLSATMPGAFTVHIAQGSSPELVFRASVTKNGIPYQIVDYLKRQALPKNAPKPPPAPKIYCSDLLDFRQRILMDLFNIQRKVFETPSYVSGSATDK